MIETQLDRNLGELRRIVQAHLAAAVSADSDIGADDIVTVTELDAAPTRMDGPEVSTTLVPDELPLSKPMMLASDTPEFAAEAAPFVDPQSASAQLEFHVSTATITAPELPSPMSLETPTSAPLSEPEPLADRPMFFAQDSETSGSSEAELGLISKAAEPRAITTYQVKKKRWWLRWLGL